MFKTVTSVFLALLFLLNVGCERQQKVSLNDLRDDTLPTFFTDEALAQIGSVPMYSGQIGDGWAFSVGDDWGSRSLAAAFGYGSERQVLLPYKEGDLHDLWIDLLIFHEYIHQADYEGLLSRSLFDERLEQMRNDPEYADVAFALDNLLDSLKDKPFGQIGEAYDDGRSREGMAYLMQFWAGGCFELPPYMLEVYDGVVLPDPVTRQEDFFYCPTFWGGFKSGARPLCAMPIP